jgi:hypothetical protein
MYQLVLCASGHLDSVRQAASEAINIMARTSDETRLNLFPSLFARLDGPPPTSMRQIARGVYLSHLARYQPLIFRQAVSLSGFAFTFHGKEVELFDLIR